MAKKRSGSKYELDEFGFSNDLDVPRMDFDIPVPKDDRKPMVSSKLGKAFVGGAKDRALDPGFMRKVMKDSLPKGYGQAMDLADDSIGSLRDLYNNATKEIKPALNDMKRFTARVLPSARKILPKKVADRIKSWSQNIDEEGAYNLGVEAQRDSMVAAQLGDIFAYQAETDAQARAEGDIKDKIKEGLNQARHRDQFAQLNAIRHGIAQQTAYRVNVESKVQRKSLELQFRQFFLAKDLYEETKRNNAFVSEQILAIKKNTGLPDWQKLTESEKLTQALRQKMFDSVFNRRNNFVRNLTKNLGGMVMDKVSGFAGGVREGLSAGNMLMDAQDSMRDLGGPTMGEFGAGMLGSAATDYAGGKLSHRLGKHLAKHRGVVKLGNKLSRGATHFPQIAGDWARSTKGFNGNNGVWDMVMGFAKDLVSQSLGGTDNKLKMDNEANLNAPGVFTRHAHKSLTEIIPGFLSRIYQELQIMRTGGDVELTSYDYTSNKFVSKSAASKAAFDKVVGGMAKSGTTSQLDRFMSKIDPQGTLNAEQRKELGLKLLTDNMDNRYGSKDRLTAAKTFGGSPHAQKYADLFSEHLKNDSSGQRQTELAEDFAQLGSYTRDSRDALQNQANLGMLDFMVESGLVDLSTGTIDMQKLYSYYYGGEYAPGKAGAGGAVKGGLRTSRRDKRAARGMASHDINAMLKAQHGSDRGAEMKVPEELLTAIRENNIRQEAASMVETLQRIEERLGSGVPSVSIDADEFFAKMHGKLSDRAQRMRDRLRRNGRGLNMSLRQVGRKFSRAASQGYSKVSGFLGNGIGAAAKNLYTAGKATVTTGLQTARVTWDKIVGEADVFIKGEALPRLSAWKLAAGQYKDEATGKIIRTYKDISGNVVDTVTGKTVLWSNEVKEAFLKSGWGVKALEGLTTVGKKAKQLVGDFTGTAGKVVMGAYSMALKLSQVLYEAEDVFTKDNLDEPKLLARIMRAGGYFSKLTGKVLRNSGDIDGPVVDKEGHEQLTLADLKTGIVGQGGKRLRVGAMKVLGKAGEMLTSGLRLAKQGLVGLGRGAMNAVSTVGNWFKNFVMPDGILFSGGKTIVERLTEIRDLLDQRMPGKRVRGDVNGDGVREGSYDDLLSKRKAQGAAQTAAGAKDGKGGKEAGWMAGLAASLNALRGKKDEPEKKDDGSLLDDAADVADIADAAGGRRGRLGRLKRWGGKAMRYGGKALGAAGVAYGAYSTYDNLKKGNYGEAAIDAGLTTAGGLAMYGGAGAMGTAAMTGLAALGTGAAALVASPVLLGAAAVAVTGLAGYGLYKLATRNSLGQLSKLRYAHYGFDPKDNSSAGRIFAMERALEKGLVWRDGQPDLDGKKVTDKDVLDALGVDTGNRAQVSKAAEWFTRRGKPVFLTHQIALRAAGGEGKSLSDVDSLKPEQKKQYLGMCAPTADALNYMQTPFAEDTPLMDATAVGKLTAAIKSELDGELKGTSKTETGSSGLNNTTAAAASAVAATAAMGAGPATSNPKADSPGGLDTPTNMQLAVAQFKGYVRTGSEVDALSAIRYKTYGLAEMVQEKVRALDMLEVYMQKGLSFTGSGQASWRGNAENAVLELGPGFGVQGINNNAGYDWMSWFNTRFLPVYLNYVTALCKATQKNDLRAALASLKPGDAVDVAQVVYGTANVWGQTASPWPGYAVNTQVGTVEQNLQALKEAARKSVLTEQTGSKAAQGTGQDNGPGVTNGTAPQGSFGKTWNALTEKAGGMFQKAREAVGSIGIGAYNAMHDEPSMLSGGRRAAPVSEGEGGMMASLPMPQGDGKYEYYQDLFAQVAKMVGVDPKLMAAMVAIESGFRASVRAPTSSATGLFQFIDGTWSTMMRKYGAKFGIPAGTPATDPRANALLGAAFLKENMQSLRGVKPEATDTDLYLAHFLGAGGAKKFFKSNPSDLAANVMPEAAKANPSIFYERDGRPRTFTEVYGHLNALVRSKGKKFGLDIGGGSLPSAAPAESASAAPAVTVPVADQTPGAAPSQAPEQQPTTTASTAAPAVVNDTSPAPTGMSQRAQDINLQQQAQRDDLSKAMGDLGTVGQASLGVQTDMLTVLRSIERLVAGRLGEQASSKETQAAQSEALARQNRSMSKPPVSMAKMLPAS